MAEPRSSGMDRLTTDFMDRHGLLCACRVVTGRQLLFYGIAAVCWGGLLLYRWDVCIFLLTVFFSLLYGLSAFFRGSAALFALFGKGADRVSAAELAALKEEDLPVYTVLIPLYREEAVAAKLLKSIGKLDYPHDKLDVKLLLECDDKMTAGALEKAGVPEWCEVITVPDGPLRTKPRACNYGLERAKGEFCVIFDAEDIPEPDQLKKAFVVFRRDKAEKLACVQAKLHYYNARENWLTRFFAIEYLVNFDLMLPGFRTWRMPLPLGGTSNHFRTDVLRRIGPWDPFNVTEDCDLGIRIGEAGYRTGLVDSVTWEEANRAVGNWFRQRSRWVKGFAQTHLVHSRASWAVLRKLGVKGMIGAYLAVGGSVLMMLCNVVFWCIVLLYGGLLLHGVLQGCPVQEMIVGPYGMTEELKPLEWGPLSLRAWPLLYIGAAEDPFWSLFSQISCVISAGLFAANFWFVLAGMGVCIKNRQWALLPSAVLMPFYWVMISLAAWKGAWQLVTKPFYWEKTRHGLTRENKP
ncbi:MAG: glycosyltransferase [Lentisphaeria bacterium]|nr:glycosyltransferase [Lentisphaeria bacterium]